MRALAHAMVRVKSFDRALAFYRDTLGFPEAFRLYNDQGQLWIVYLHVGGRQFVELSLAQEEPPKGSFTGFHHLCFEVDDIQAWYEKLRPLGCVTADPKLGRDGSWQIWIRDPDGNPIELMQYTADSRQTAFLRQAGVED